MLEKIEQVSMNDLVGALLSGKMISPYKEATDE